MADSIVGIDLGTSNSVVAVCDQGGNVKVLADESGSKVQPSVVSFHPNGSVIVGAEAKQRKVLDPKNTVYSAKRLIGRSFRSREVQTTMGRMPYVIREGGNQQAMIVTRAGEFAVPEISAIVLDHMRKIAVRATGTEVTRAVVTVPAAFTEAQRTATATAGAIAGMTIVRVLNEPTAAALAYGHTRQLKRTIAVFDFGGGTFDITVLKLNDNIYEVLGTAGDTFLGGDDIDERVVDVLVAGFLAENRIDLRQNEIALMRLRAVAEQTKIELSRRSRAIIKVDEIAYGPGGAPLNLQQELTRDQLVAGCVDVVDRAFPVCDESLKLASLRTQDIDDVILVGGTTKMPYVRDRVAAYFGKAPRTDINPEEAVAIGAALQAAALERILAKRPSVRVTGAQPILRADSETTAGGTEITHADAIRPADSITLDNQSSTTLELLQHRDDTFDEQVQTRPGEMVPMPPEARPPETRPPSQQMPRRTAPGTAAPAPGTASSTRPPPDRPVERGAAVDRFENRGNAIRAPGAPIGRMTKPGAPPPVPGRTLVGVPNQDTPASSRPRTQPIAGLSPMPPGSAPISPLAPNTGSRPLPTTAPGVQPPPRAAPPAAPGAPSWTPDRPAMRTEAPASPSQAQSSIPTTVLPVPPLPTTAPGVMPPARSVTFDEPTRPAQPIRALEGEPTRPAGPDLDMILEAAEAEAGTSIGPAPDPDPDPDFGPEFDLPPPTRPAAPAPPLVPAAAPAAPTMIAMAASGAASGPNLTMRGRVDGPSASPSPSSTDRGVPPPGAAARPPAPAVPSQARGPEPGSVPNLLMPQVSVIDVTPRAFGIATVAGYCEELIRRNVRLPTETRKTFITSRDRQQVVRIRICQGESRRLDDNVVIGDLVLDNLEPRPRGETTIEVTFQIDASGILNVRARDARSGREQRAQVDIVGAQSPDEVAASRDRLQQMRR